MPPAQKSRNPPAMRGDNWAADRNHQEHAKAIERLRVKNEIKKYGAFGADIRRRKRRDALIAPSVAYASANNPDRQKSVLAQTVDPYRYYTKAQIRANPALSELVAERRAAIADQRGKKLDRTSTEQVQALLGYSGLPPGALHKASQIVAGAGETAGYTPAGLYHLATTDPRKTVPETLHGLAQPFVHPLRTWKNDPFQTVAAGLMLANTGASAVGRAGAISAARQAGATRGAVLRAGLKHPGGGSRTIVHPFTGETTQALNFNSAMGPFAGKLSDKILGVAPKKPKPPAEPRWVTPPSSVETKVTVPNPAHEEAANRAAQATRRVKSLQQARIKASGPRVTITPRTAKMVDARIAKLEAATAKTVDSMAKSLRAEGRGVGERPSMGHQVKQVGTYGDREHLIIDEFKKQKEMQRKGTWPKNKRTYGSWEEMAVEKYGAHTDSRGQYKGFDETNVNPKKVVKTDWTLDQYRAEAEAELRKVYGPHAAKNRTAGALVRALDELQSLRTLRQKNQGGLADILFPEDKAPGFGVDVRSTGTGAGSPKETRIAAQLADAHAAKAAAIADKSGIPATLERVQVTHVPGVREAAPPAVPGRNLRPAGLTRLAAKRFESEKMQNQRLAETVRINRLSPDELQAELLKTVGRTNAARRWMRTSNRVQRMLLLYAKLGYIPSNVISQEAMSLIHQGVYMPINRVQSAMLRNTPMGKAIRPVLGPLGLKPLTAQAKKDLAGAAGMGRTVSTFPDVNTSKATTGFGEKVHRGAQRLDERVGHAFGKVVDDPYRFSALIHELRRAGIPARDIQKLHDAAEVFRTQTLKNPGMKHNSAAFDKLNETSRRGQRAIVDYGRMGKASKWLRDFIFIYPWVKGAIHYTAQFPMEHPYQTFAATAVAKEGKKHSGLHGRLPSFEQGSFVVGHRDVKGLGKVPLVVNPRYVNTVTQPFDTFGSAATAFHGLIPGMPAGSRYKSIADVLQPLLGDALDQYNKTGQFNFGSLLNTVWASSPPARLYQGVAPKSWPLAGGPVDPRSKLYPRSQRDFWAAFTGGSMMPKPRNPVVGQSIARVETEAGLSARQKADLHAQWLNEDVFKKLASIQGHPVTALQKTQLKMATELVHEVAIGRLYVTNKYPQYRRPGKGKTLDHRGEFLAAAWALLVHQPDGTRKIGELAQQLQQLPADYDFKKEGKQLPITTGISRLKTMIGKWNNASGQMRPYAQGGAPMSVPK